MLSSRAKQKEIIIIITVLNSKYHDSHERVIRCEKEDFRVGGTFPIVSL